MLDDVDRQLLVLLQEDARATHAALAKAVGLTGPSVYARLKRLEADGVIRGYATLVDPDVLGQGVVAFLRVGTVAAADEGEPFESHVHADPRILECHDVDGEDSYLLKVRTTSPQELRGLIADIRALPGITRTVTTIVLETVKEPLRTGRADG